LKEVLQDQKYSGDNEDKNVQEWLKAQMRLFYSEEIREMLLYGNEYRTVKAREKIDHRYKIYKNS
jgi:hypothetical protein